MRFEFQQNALNQLATLAEYDCHSLLLYSNSGCGKTYLAKQYAKLLQIDDFIKVDPKVSEIKSTIANCLSLKNNILLCIENIDEGVNSASQSLLKILEEPPSHIYIIITCRNFTKVPDTIISRSKCVELGCPTENDIFSYAESRDKQKCDLYKKYNILSCIRSFSDIDCLNKLDKKDIEYISQCPSIISMNIPISMISWNLQNTSDKHVLPIHIVISYIHSQCNDKDLKKICLTCLNGLSESKLGKSAILSKFLFDYKLIVQTKRCKK
uniref:DNA polymerase III, delta' subunit n=1 Tax=Siphoviridae sp. ctX5W26 TaxID=2825540 RepID=A0A8S5UEF8_9CAUD|nr:MAG TPA: DNA polymerase III, delta' subunit [Siphoviridae sp. ctX5W26]